MKIEGKKQEIVCDTCGKHIGFRRTLYEEKFDTIDGLLCDGCVEKHDYSDVFKTDLWMVIGVISLILILIIKHGL